MNNVTPPPYSPNTVNQTVDYGGMTWKGQPGGQWTQQTQTGGAPVATGNAMSDATNYSQWAQQQQLSANQPAIQTLTSQKQSLADQYKTLLDSVLGQGSVAQNYAVSAANQNLAQRGITSDSVLGQQSIAQQLLPVTAQNQSQAAQVGMGSAQDMNQLAAEIAALQAGNMPNALSFGGNLSQVQATIQQAQIGANKPFSSNGLVFNPQTNTWTTAPTSPIPNKTSTTTIAGNGATPAKTTPQSSINTALAQATQAPMNNVPIGNWLGGNQGGVYNNNYAATGNITPLSQITQAYTQQPNPAGSLSMFQF